MKQTSGHIRKRAEEEVEVDVVAILLYQWHDIKNADINIQFPGETDQ